MKSLTIYGKGFLLVGFFLLASSAFGQDLGSGNSIFRSPNPKTGKASSKKTTATPKAASKKSTTSSAKTPPKVKPKTTPKPVTAAKIKTPAKTKVRTPQQNTAAQTEVKPVYQPNDVVITVGQSTSGDFDELFEKAIEEGNLARDDREYTKAEAAYLRAQSLKARDSRAIYGLGNLYSDQQRWEEAERAYRTAIQLEPDSPEAHIALSFVLTQPIAGSDVSDRYSEAEKMARRALQLDDKNPLGYDQLGVALELRGIINDETVNAYRRAIALDSEFALAYAHLGRLLRRKGQVNESSAAYRTAISLSNDVPTMILVADVMQSQQRYVESEQLLRRALRQDPKNPTALFLLGRALTTRGSFEEAESVLKKSADVSPNSFVSYMLLGSMYARQNKFDNAEKALIKALKVVSLNEKKRLAMEFETVGDGYFRAGKGRDAARVYRQALELDSEKSVLSGKIMKAQGI